MSNRTPVRLTRPAVDSSKRVTRSTNSGRSRPETESLPVRGFTYTNKTKGDDPRLLALYCDADLDDFPPEAA
jgi:hypothetical protein